MKVGIALPVYNALQHVERCLTTLRAQTHPVDIYVVDDCSDDGSSRFLDHRPTWYTEYYRHSKRCGWPLSLDRAADMALSDGCDAVFVMNADDFLRLDCIEKCVQGIKNKDWVVMYGQQIGGENVVQTPLVDPLVYESFFGENCPLGSPALITAKAWKKIGGYAVDISLPDSYGYNEDWDFWIRMFKYGFDRYAVIKEPVYYYVMHEGQLHKEGLSRHKEARSLIMKKHGKQ